MNKRLYRSEYDKAICGVCAGFGHYFGIDPIVVRLIFVLSFMTFGVGRIFYIACAIVIPKEPEGMQWAEAQSREASYGGYESYGSSDPSNGGSATHYDGAGGEGPYTDYYSSEEGSSEKKDRGPFDGLKEEANRENIGVILVIIGGYLLIRFIFPRIDFKLIVGLAALAAGIYVMKKK